MGFANKYLSSLRKMGRKVVLPSENIKAILESAIDFSKVKNIVDFGAGTLYWSEYFASKACDFSVDSSIDSNANRGGQMTYENQLESAKKRRIFAVDSIYRTITPKTPYENIIFEVDIFKILHFEIDLIFMSDVLHHISNHGQILQEICGDAKYIAIKDIDANYKFGDFMNKSHDFLINKERVHSIFPQNLAQILEQSGYITQYFYLPKLWYPHFLIIAKKESK